MAKPLRKLFVAAGPRVIEFSFLSSLGGPSSLRVQPKNNFLDIFYSFFEDFGSQRYSILWYYTSISEIKMVGIYLWNKFMVFLLHL